MSTSIGRAGAHFCAAALQRLGVQCTISQQDGYDLVAFVPTPVRVEVKTSAGLYKSNGEIYQFGTNRGSNKKLLLNSEHADVVALVALPERAVLFKNVEDIVAMQTRIRASEFCGDNEAKSWLRAIERLK